MLTCREGPKAVVGDATVGVVAELSLAVMGVAEQVKEKRDRIHNQH
jgi:hypothetical protein